MMIWGYAAFVMEGVLCSGWNDRWYFGIRCYFGLFDVAL